LSKELETAASAEICNNCGHIELVYSNLEQPFRDKNKPCWEESGTENNDLELNELVRRQDVEQLIKERLESHRKRVEENNALDRLNLNDAKARVNELENLLEDVQNE